jgi:hypothetical protein
LWVFDSGFGLSPREHDFLTDAVVIRCRIHAANNSETVSLLGSVREKFADVRSGNGGWDGPERTAGIRARFGIPGFELANATGKKDHEHPLLRSSQLCGSASRCKAYRPQGG